LPVCIIIALQGFQFSNIDDNKTMLSSSITLPHDEQKDWLIIEDALLLVLLALIFPIAA